MTLSFQQYINTLSDDTHIQALTGIGRGIEREGLRVLSQGRLSEHDHYHNLGAALTHPNITTDYSECLLEFITPVSHSPEEAIAQLRDTQKFTLSQINDELIWPMSMPCFVDDDDKIVLAKFGNSNVGKMKTVYRQGLKNRYGSMMQVIAGIHFNFSFSDSFWQTLKVIDDNHDEMQDYVSARYFSLLRNYKRYCWLIPYLYGSSPAICPSFLQNKATTLPFKKSKSGYLYLEHATSLRMSDLGYTNSEQSSLHICYNNLEGYLNGVKEAINIKSEEFEKIGIKVDGKYQQLNSNVLQIENELYAPIRPKQVANSGEKPSQALQSRGVQYIEVRALDVNPFADTGIDQQQIYFLDIFLTFCALMESPTLDCDKQNICEENMDEVVVRGRDPQLLLSDEGIEKSIETWGGELFYDMEKVARLLDKAYQCDKYSEAIAIEKAKLTDSSLTPSAKILAIVVEKEQSLTQFALAKAKSYRAETLKNDYQYYSQQYFIDQAEISHQKQAEIEQEDKVDFDTFIHEYFKEV
ncbi:glutamate--cysteine ligase [Thalassotalea castellviae]|uniref:Glutamate--cysteine ligase n=1 Tax=Thalassotalea castellviae TaxID=3075612 RepID=A0ABU2ZYM0_9GAMM|nr:glutamate--cysteine ligase [Thalassotalea sp. W431]MDT0603010.1 glutamate--cysteine ligase [Thalassotalea sp. W431]